MELKTIPIGEAVKRSDGGLYQKVEILNYEEQLNHLPEWKRPPKQVWKTLIAGVRLEEDRTANRKVIPQKFPGKSIKDLKNTHFGAVAILFNGHSMAEHDLHKIQYPMIGMNRTIKGYPTYDGPNPDYYVFIDCCWINRDYVRNHPKLLNASSDGKELGYRINKSYRMKPFSWDLFRDGAAPVNTGFIALQVAVYLGFTEIYCLGLDGSGPHFDGTPSGNGMRIQHRSLTGLDEQFQAKGIDVWLCGSPDSPAPFRHRTFEDLIGGK